MRDFRQAGVEPPILVGGAALSNRFTRLRIGPEYDGLVAYAQDAMSGLALANTLQDADERQKLAASIEEETDELIRSTQAADAAAGFSANRRRGSGTGQPRLRCAQPARPAAAYHPGL